jgi:chromosome segregation ATPase
MQKSLLQGDVDSAAARAETAEKHLSTLQTLMRVRSPASLKGVISALQKSFAESERQLKETQEKLASWRESAKELTVERDQAEKQCSDLRRALSAAERSVAELTADLSSETSGRIAAEQNAEGAHAEAAQRKQVSTNGILV